MQLKEQSGTIFFQIWKLEQMLYSSSYLFGKKILHNRIFIKI